MKRISVVLFALACFASTGVSISRAQDAATAPTFKRFTLGPSFTAGGSVWTGDIATGLKTSGEFSFDAGLLGYYATNESFGLMLAIVYDARNINFHKENDATVYDNISLGYLAFEPGLKFKDFTLGLGIGIPMSGSATETLATVLTPTTHDVKSQVNTIVEIRIGGSVPILESETGDFRFIINASYPFTKTFTQNLVVNPNTPILFYKSDGPTPTLRAGFSYLFSLGN